MRGLGGVVRRPAVAAICSGLNGILHPLSTPGHIHIWPGRPTTGTFLTTSPQLRGLHNSDPQKAAPKLPETAPTPTPIATTTTPLAVAVPSYVDKLQGVPGAAPGPAPTFTETAWAGALSFVGIGALSVAHFGLTGVVKESILTSAASISPSLLLGLNSLSAMDTTLLIGSFGASAALVFGAPTLPPSQPRAVVLGHMLTATIGVTCFKLLPVALACPAAVSLSVMGMLMTGFFHPPAAANGLVFIMGSSAIHDLGYSFALVPCGICPMFLCALAAFMHNLRAGKRYPQYW